MRGEKNALLFSPFSLYFILSFDHFFLPVLFLRSFSKSFLGIGQHDKEKKGGGDREGLKERKGIWGATFCCCFEPPKTTPW